jgi:predicted amidophosphoribosyltransferase
MKLTKDRNPDGSITWILDTNKNCCDFCKKKLLSSDAVYFCPSAKEIYCFDCALNVDHKRYMDKRKQEPHIHYKVILRGEK